MDLTWRWQLAALSRCLGHDDLQTKSWWLSVPPETMQTVMVSTNCCPSSRICRLCSQSKTILGLKEDRACLSHGQRGPDKLHLLWDPASDAFRGVLAWEVEGPCYYLHGGKCWMDVLCLLLVAPNHRCKYPDSKGSVGTRNKVGSSLAMKSRTFSSEEKASCRSAGCLCRWG